MTDFSADPNSEALMTLSMAALFPLGGLVQAQGPVELGISNDQIKELIFQVMHYVGQPRDRRLRPFPGAAPPLAPFAKTAIPGRPPPAK
jgi:hypothetical protein